MGTSGGSSGGSGAVHVAQVHSTAGNITFNNTSASGFIPVGSLTGGTGSTQFDLQVTAATGDLILIGVNCVIGFTDNNVFFDMQLGTSLNFLSSGTATGAGNGVAGWQLADIGQLPVAPDRMYTVQSADIFSGHVLFRWIVKTTTTGTATVYCSTTNPVYLYALNMTALALGS